MFGSYSANRASAYAKVGVETGVSAADPHKLVLMLLDGAVMSVSAAVVAMERNEIAAKGQSISKAIEIISDGLKASLDRKAGGELAERLAGLYDYLCMRLLYANLHNDRVALDEVSGLLESLRESWRGISPSATKQT